jgi:hypothetical protein
MREQLGSGQFRMKEPQPTEGGSNWGARELSHEKAALRI